MNDVLAWVLSVFVVGIFINLVSAYIKPWIDRVLSHFFTAYRKWLQKGVELRMQAAKEMLKDPFLAIELRLDLLRYEIRFNASLGAAFLCMLLAVVVVFTIPATTLLSQVGLIFLLIFVSFFMFSALYISQRITWAQSILWWLSIFRRDSESQSSQHEK